jgi:hypothetical protein
MHAPVRLKVSATSHEPETLFVDERQKAQKI